MTRRAKLQPTVSKKEFRDKIAELADEFARHIELNVEAFEPDPQAKAERLSRIEDEDGFQFFMETYLPHYVRGEHSLFHQHIFARVPEIHLAGGPGASGAFAQNIGSSELN